MTEMTVGRSRHVRPLLVALAITTAGVAPGFVAGAMAVQMQPELRLSDAIFGLGLATFFAAGGLLALPGGRLADRLGWRRSVQIAGSANLLAVLLIAVGARNSGTFVAFMFLSGATLALTGPAGNLVLAREMPRHRLGLVFGIKQAAIPLATMSAGLAVPVIALTVGWRWAFVAAATYPAVALVATAAHRPAIHATDLDPRPLSTRRRTGRGLVAFALSSGLATTGTGALAGFFVLSSVRLGLSEATAGVFYAVASGAGLLVRVLAGWLADRYVARGFVAVRTLMLVGASGFLLLALRSESLVLPGALLAFACGWSWAGLLLYGVVRQHPDGPAASTATVQVGSTAGVAFGPMLFGLMSQHFGDAAGWLTAGSMLILAAAFVWLGDRWLGERVPAVTGAVVSTPTPGGGMAEAP